MDILQKIIAQKQLEIEQLHQLYTTTQLEKLPLYDAPRYSLCARLQAAPGIIAECKRQSPSRGIITPLPDSQSPAFAARICAGYAAAGAAGISVLTDAPFFGGIEADLEAAAAVRGVVPLLRKDFILDEHQILAARARGADVVLLICACLTPARLRTLATFAHAQGLEVLMEVHSKAELVQYLNPEIDLVGVNNRNLRDFAENIDTSLALAEQIPAEFVKVSESSLRDATVIRELAAVGYRGFLIGEAFMRTEQPAQALSHLLEELGW